MAYYQSLSRQPRRPRVNPESQAMIRLALARLAGAPAGQHGSGGGPAQPPAPALTNRLGAATSQYGALPAAPMLTPSPKLGAPPAAPDMGQAAVPRQRRPPFNPLDNYSPDPNATPLGNAIRAGAGGNNPALRVAINHMNPLALAMLIAANSGRGRRGV